MFVRSLLAGVSLLAVASAAQAAPITNFTESLTSPQAPAGSVLTPIKINGVGITTPSQTSISGTGYTVSFNTSARQGIVQGTMANVHAVPVAGGTMTAPTYLTGDYGSGTTTSMAGSGNYFSTDLGVNKITITFASAQTSLALLIGSIDASNLITLSNGDTLTGAQLQAIPGFAGNGSQGLNGSAYVSFTDSPFTTVSFSSGVVSFEFAGVVGSTTPFTVPEPMSLALLGGSLAAVGFVRRRRLQG